VPIGITLQFNNGNTSGHNWSVAAEGATNSEMALSPMARLSG
jgi:hypothetical protein